MDLSIYFLVLSLFTKRELPSQYYHKILYFKIKNTIFVEILLFTIYDIFYATIVWWVQLINK